MAAGTPLMKAAIIVLEWPGSSPCRAPSRMAEGMNTQAWAAPCCRRSESGVTAQASQVLGDFLELFDGAARLDRRPARGVFKAVADMIVDQQSFGVGDGLLDGVQLLRQFQAGPAGFDHADDAAQVPLGPLQALGDLRVAEVQGGVGHALTYPPG